MANFIESIFGKPPAKLKLEDVQEFFKERQEETSTLEFKSGDITLEKLFKSVAGFLNSEGGLLIIGAPKEREEKISEQQRVRYAQGELITCNSFKTREAITQKLGSNIAPPPAGINIVQFHTGAGSIYLIEIPQSVSPPHQVQGSGVYYLRNDNTTLPASHGIVSALFNQRKIPKLTARVNVISHEGKMNVTVTVTNESIYPADKVAFLVQVYNPLAIEKLETKTQFADLMVRVERAIVKADVVLPKDLGESRYFNIIYGNKDILLCITYWCGTSSTECKFIWFDGMKNKVKEMVVTDQVDHEILGRYLKFIAKKPKERVNTYIKPSTKAKTYG